MLSQNKLLVILGPTSTGKTDLALTLAKKFKGEIISCDSRQVYKGLDIASGKLPNKKVPIKKGRNYWKVDGVKIWLIDILEPKKQYSVFHYIKDARKIIKKLEKRNKRLIIVGGTGLYLRALLEGLSNLAIPSSKGLRKELEKLSLEELQARFKKLSLRKWESLNFSDKQNPRRLIRAIELIHMYPYRRTYENKGLNKNYQILKIGLTAPRSVLYEFVDKRISVWLKQGLIEEGKVLLKKGVSSNRLRQLGLEYRILADYLEGKILGSKQLIKIMQDKTHSYVKRQLTWFKKEKAVFWFDITDKNYSTQVENYIARWYHGQDDPKN